MIKISFIAINILKKKSHPLAVEMYVQEDSYIDRNMVLLCFYLLLPRGEGSRYTISNFDDLFFILETWCAESHGSFSVGEIFDDVYEDNFLYSRILENAWFGKQV